MSIQREKVVEKEGLLNLLGDKQVRDILIYLIKRPRSITEISKEFRIPKSTAYRMVHELEAQGLIKAVGSIINERGRRSYMYISRVKSINISLSLDGLNIEIDPNNIKVDLLSLSNI